MTAVELLNDLRAAGITVKEDPGWRLRGDSWAYPRPAGVMHHHTARPVPYPISRLNGSNDGLVKCNMNTKPDGTLWLVSYGACNYSSGPGARLVLDQMREGIVPTANAAERRLVDDYNANPYFWNFENDHVGDGSALPLVQFETIVKATIVVLAHFHQPHTSVISHAESTARKIDPKWNGSNRTAIEQIRAAVKKGMTVATGPNGEPNWDEVSTFARNAWSWAWGENILSKDSHPQELVTLERMMVFLRRDEADEGDFKPSSGGVSEAQARALAREEITKSSVQPG